jgi:DNA-binding NtrC family response regulator
MTAYGSPEITAGALALGAYRVVSKPFEVQDLVTLVQEARTSAHARRALRDLAGQCE